MKNCDTRNEIPDLTPYETEQLKAIMHKLEEEEYYNGWHLLNGGFAKCEMIDYDDETIEIDLVYGQQDMGDGHSEERTDSLTIDREILANTEMTLADKIKEVK